MDLNQGKNPNTSMVIIRKSSPSQIVGLILAGFILGSAVIWIFGLFRADKAVTSNPVASQADQNKQPEPNTSFGASDVR